MFIRPTTDSHKEALKVPPGVLPRVKGDPRGASSEAFLARAMDTFISARAAMHDKAQARLVSAKSYTHNVDWRHFALVHKVSCK